MGLDLILYWKMCNYWKVILPNLKMFLCDWWLIFCHHKRHIQNLFQKLSIFKTECSSPKIWDCQWQIVQFNTSFYHLDLVASFSNYQNTSMLLFYFDLFFIFSYGQQCPCDQLSNFFEHYFPYFLICFSHGSLMETNSTLVYFRSRMLCSNDEK